jgi:chemotaxis protein MotB
MSAKSNAPVIIKRKKVIAGGGHHGGAWKVAYADFVTAMMAFFLLMWLLNATTEKQRKGIADYFNPTIPVNRISGGGDGAFSGDSVFAQESLSQNGTGATQPAPTPQRQSKGESGVGPGSQNGEEQSDEPAFAQVQSALMANSGESMASNRAMRHIVTRVTDEGLIIELFDIDGDPLFDAMTAEPTAITRELVGVLARVSRLVANRIAVNGHVRSFPLVLADNPVWRLSRDRASAIRDLVVADGLSDRRFKRVTAYADRKLAAENPMAARNNRIELILLRSDKG